MSLLRSRITSFFLSVVLAGLAWLGCGLAATKPTQEMSDATAALKAAKEVQADTLAPELYRAAKESYLQAKRDYQLKDYKESQIALARARRLAEQAEYEAIKNGAERQSMAEAPPLPPKQQKKSESNEGIGTAEAPPGGIWADQYEQTVKENEQSQIKQDENTAPNFPDSPTPVNPLPPAKTPAPQAPTPPTPTPQ